MLKHDTFEALMWAHRYAIDYNGTVRNDNITRVYLNDMVALAPHLSSAQVSHLLTDLNRYLEWQEQLAETYPEDKPSDAVYEYKKLLESVSGTEEVLDEPVPFSMVYRACMYCITRNSYSASYGRDVFPFLKYFTRAEKNFLKEQIHSYMIYREAGSDPVDDCWYDLYEYLRHELETGFVEVTATNGAYTETAICFIDKKENYRPIDRVTRPYTYVPKEYVVNTRRLDPLPVD